MYYIERYAILYNDFNGGVIMSQLNDFGTRLKKLRTGKGLTQRQLADLMYISNSTIANWETGTRMPDINMLTRLARCLNVDIYTLIDDTTYRGSSEAFRIIIVEDVPVVLRGSIRMLEDEVPRAEIAGFDNGRDAIDYAKNNKVSVAFLDIELPGENGMELGRTLTAINHKTNIIYLTSHTEYLEEAAYDHCSGYIIKPLTRERIHHELGNLRYPVGGFNI